jgi:hypothetical protein
MKIFSFFFIIALIVLGMMATGTGFSGMKTEQHGGTESEETGENAWPAPSANVITIKADGEILHYQKESFWKDQDFSDIQSSRKQYEADETSSFRNKLERHDVHLSNIHYDFSDQNKSIAVTCTVKGPMYSTDSYDFHWLLGDLPFDLYQFEQHEKELIYEGTIDGISTEIRLLFSFPISHCHEHVWPK